MLTPRLGFGLVSLLCLLFFMLDSLGVFEPALNGADLNAADCLRLRGPVGAEDGVFVFDDVMIITELDAVSNEFTNAAVHGGGPANARGGLWALDRLDSDVPRLTRLRVPLPSGVRLIAHGIGFHKGSGVIFVVNHAYEQGGERIERFRVTRRHSLLGPPLKLTYLSSVTAHNGADGHWDFSDRLLGVINDVAPVGEHEFFFTQYHPHPAPMEGVGSEPPASVPRLLGRKHVPFLRGAHIYHCHCAHPHKQECLATVCRPVGPAAASWNGITTSANGRTVYANDIFWKDVVELRVVEGEADGDVTLHETRRLRLPYLVDNVYFREGCLWAGAIPNAIKVLDFYGAFREKAKVAHAAAVANGTSTPRPYLHLRESVDSEPDPPAAGGVLKIDLSTGAMTSVVMQSKLLAGVSFSAQAAGKVVFGGPYDDGVVVCPQPAISRERKHWIV